MDLDGVCGQVRFSVGYQLPGGGESLVEVIGDHREAVAECYCALPGDPSSQARDGNTARPWDLVVTGGGIAGAAGRMGKTLLKCVAESPEFKLTGATEFAGSPFIGKDAPSGTARGSPR